jgi:hypothetical protein
MKTKSLRSKQTQKRPNTQNNFPYATPLESNHGIPQNQRHPARHENARPQKHPKHAPIHSADQLRIRRLPLGNRPDRSGRPKTNRGRLRIRLRVQRCQNLQEKKVMQPNDRAAVIVVGPLGFEPRIACAPGMYPNPDSKSYSQDTMLEIASELSKLDDGPIEIHVSVELNETERAMIKTFRFIWTCYGIILDDRPFTSSVFRLPAQNLARFNSS